MNYARYGVTSLILLLLFGTQISGQEVKQETKAGTTAQEVKPEAKQANAPPDAKQEVKPAETRQDTRSGPALKEKRVAATMDADGIQRVEVTGAEYYFDPNYIVVKVNNPVELKVRKGADASWFIPHDMMARAPEAGIDFIIDLKKDPQSVHFTPTKTGKYPFYCNKKPPFGGKSHRDRGMEGVIEVVE